MDASYQTKLPLPTGFERWLVKQLPAKPTEQRQLCDGILSLSDHFQDNLPTPWQNPAFVRAYSLYFLPLNLIRLQKVIARLEPLGFFEGIDTVVDIGSGPGTGALAFDHFDFIKTVLCFEPERAAVQAHQSLIDAGLLHSKNDWLDHAQSLQDWVTKDNVLTLMSYSLNEMNDIPVWLMQCRNLLIVEPSTHQKGRQLLELRKQLLAQSNLHIWGPCTHQDECPMLKHSKKDFCHDRVIPQLPEAWLSAVEKNLPIKNRSITMSYLAASFRNIDQSENARITGDPQKQKGKTLQMVCKGSGRQFLSWMDKKKNYQEIPRGELIDGDFDSTEKSNELRVLSPIKVKR